jgi:hypothetical protein
MPTPSWLASRLSRITIVVILCLAVSASLYFAYRWKMDSFINEWEVTSWAQYAASEQAHSDFLVGTRRQYEIIDADGPDRRGEKIRQDGSVEVIGYIVFPRLGPIHIKASHQYVKKYNEVMQRLMADPSEANPNHWGGLPFDEASEPAPAPTVP